MGVLVHAAQLRDVGQAEVGQLQIAQQADPPRRSGSEQQLFELVANPFAADRRQRGRGVADRCRGVGLDLEAEAARKTDRAEQPQGVLVEALGWGTDGSDDSVAQIVLTAKRVVDRAAARVERDGVDGEVAPRQIVQQAATELHLWFARAWPDRLRRDRS